MARVLSFLLLTAALVSGCVLRSSEQAIPPGAHLSGDARALTVILERLEGLTETPLARFARAMRSRAEGCGEFSASAPEPDPDALTQNLSCGPPSDLPPALRSLRGEDDLVLVFPLGDRARLVGSARVSPDGSVRYRGRLDVPNEDGPLRLLLPGASPPGPPRLSARDAVLQVRIRPDAGLNVATLVPRGSQGDRLFRLKSELFLGTVLGGTWEAAVYLPSEGRSMPDVALGLDLRVRDAAVEAVERFIRDLESAWPVHRAPLRVGGWSGACLPDLRILPEFAPCYVATDTVLVFGWNIESVRRALHRGPESEMGGEGGLLVRLDRLSEADRLLQSALLPGGTPPPLRYGWDRLLARARPGEAALEIRLDLVEQGTP